MTASDWNQLSEKAFRKNNQEALKYGLKANSIAFDQGDKTEIGKSHLNIANASIELSNTVLAIHHIDSSIAIFKKIKNNRMLGQAFRIKGDALTYNTDYDAALTFFFKSVACFEKGENYEQLAEVFNSIGIAYHELKNPQLAINHYQKSLRYATKINSPRLKAITWLNMGIVFMNEKKNSAADQYYQSALKVFDSLNLEQESIVVLSNIAINFKRIKKYDKSIEAHQKVLVHSLERQDSIGIARTINNIANAYRGKKEYKVAILKYLEALEISERINYVSNIRLCYRNLAFTYSDIGDFKNAYKYRSLQLDLEIEAYNSEKDEIALELNKKYQTEQKENDILRLSNEKNQEKAKTANLRLWNYGIAGGSFMLILAGIFLWSRRKQRHQFALEKQKTEALLAKVNASEEEKKRIGKQLHDGVANDLIKCFFELENSDPELSHKFLTAYEEVRTVSHQLNNSPGHGTLLIDRLADLIPENTTVKFSVDITPFSLEMREPLGTHVYRIIQELIVNTLKYADCKEVKITVDSNKELLIINYVDNGKGTDTFKKGSGHQNIQDRITLLKGTAEISTSSNNGFSMNIIIPLQ